MAGRFGDLLRTQRERRGFAQVQLARMVDLSNSMVHLLESGERRPTRDQARRLADALGLPSAETDALLAAGGHLPLVYDQVPPDDPDLLRIARTLGNPSVALEERARLRLLLRLLFAPWEQAGLDPVALVHAEIPQTGDDGRGAEPRTEVAEGGADVG